MGEVKFMKLCKAGLEYYDVVNYEKTLFRYILASSSATRDMCKALDVVFRWDNWNDIIYVRGRMYRIEFWNEVV